MSSTTIVIPGRETQVIPEIEMSKSDVIAAFAGDINLGNMTATETRDESGVTITFANKTGTKGNDVVINTEVLNVSVEGDVVVNNTRIEIPGREAQVIPGLVMTPSDVQAAFAGDVDLSGMTFSEEDLGDTHLISFANRTGTKGQTNLMQAIVAAVQQAQEESTALAQEEAPVAVAQEETSVAVEETLELNSTRIVIPGREDQVIEDIVLDAQMVKDSFSGEIDLSGYNVEEVENGNTLEVRFTARTGTKGNNRRRNGGGFGGDDDISNGH